VWIVTVYEPLPINDPKTRPQRCGMLAQVLAKQGHQVELWTSTFEHVQHCHHRRDSACMEIGQGVRLQFIDACGYAHDHSPKRFMHNHQTKREFTRIARTRSALPDIIFAPVPTLELAEAVVDLSVVKKIPIVIDVRDLWPDVYFSMFPPWARFIVRYALTWEIRRARKIFKSATGITAVSQAYLDWALNHAQRSKSRNDSVFPLGFISNNNHRNIKSNKSGADQYYIDKDHFVVTFVGTLSGFNSLDCVVGAARLLQNEKKLKILIVGDGEHRKRLQERAKDLPNLILTGWLDLLSIKEILSFTKVGLISYAKAAPMSLPNKPFEYMAASLPLLSSLPGELEQLISNNQIGRIFAAENPESLAMQLRWFLNNSQQAEIMGKRAGSLFKSFFQSDIVYSKLVKHLERIVGQSHDQRKPVAY
jgi:glycosyltransferase involved in cell wall biosynthesis